MHLYLRRVIKIDEVEIKCDELPILINCLGENLSINYPIYRDFNIVTAHGQGESFKLKLDKRKEDFQVEADRFGSYGKEMPSYSDILECLLASGIVRYENYDEFINRIKALSQINKTVIFSPDSNNLYHRFPSICDELNPQNFLVTNIVKNEIQASINEKYSVKDINEMKRCADFNSNMLDELINKATKKSRKANYLARREFLYLKNNNARIDDSIIEEFKDKEENDRLIIRILKSLEAKYSKLVYMLTADNLMARLCEMEGLSYFQFQIPGNITVNQCTFQGFSDFTYNLACILGLIKINSVIIFGEYKGKANLEGLKLKFLNDNMAKSFLKHLEVCRKLKKIGVER